MPGERLDLAIATDQSLPHPLKIADATSHRGAGGARVAS